MSYWIIELFISSGFYWDDSCLHVKVYSVLESLTYLLFKSQCGMRCNKRWSRIKRSNCYWRGAFENFQKRKQKSISKCHSFLLAKLHLRKMSLFLSSLIIPDHQCYGDIMCAVNADREIQVRISTEIPNSYNCSFFLNIWRLDQEGI